MFWEAEKECMAREDLEQLQLERLQSTLYRVGTHVPFYKKKFDQLQFNYDSIRSLDDLRRLPFTEKQDLRDNYPYGLFAVPLRDVVRVHSSSGTSGQATVVGYTRNDIKTWSNLVARVITAAGVTRNDVIQIAFGYGLFTGGFGLHYGAELIGASVIPISAGNTKRQIQIMQDFKTTALVCTPSYALVLADAMMEMGVNPNGLSLRFGLFGGEPWSEAMRQEIRQKLGIVATDNYGLSEVMGPGVAGECRECNGLHVSEDHFLIEILNPETLEPVAPGEVGELVITTLTKEAFPVIRYRTRDLTRLLPPTARSFRRIGKITGRSDDMLIVRGVNVFPTQFEEQILRDKRLSGNYQIVLTRDGHMDNVEVRCELQRELSGKLSRSETETMARELQHHIKTIIGISTKVNVLEFEGIPRTLTGKARRVIDQRPKQL